MNRSEAPYILDSVDEQEVLSRSANLLESQRETLLEISEAIASHRNLTELFHGLAPRLHRVVQFDFLNLILREPEREIMRSHLLECPDPDANCPSQGCPMETPAGWVWQTQEPWVVSRLDSELTKFPELCGWLYDRGMRSLCVVPVTTALRKLGALAFGSTQKAAYPEIDVVFLKQVARHVAVAVDNALNFEQAQSVQQQLKEQHDRLRLLLEVNTVVSALDLRELLNAVSAALRRLVPHEYASLSLYDADTQRLNIHALDFPVSKGMLTEGLSVPVEGSPTGR
ncbi:MAG: GAF domain-containing protein, partial [Candidatus Binatia bacterium]